MQLIFVVAWWLNLVASFSAKATETMVSPVPREPTPDIVLVDDDPDVLQAIRQALSLAGFPVSETTDPRKAIEILSETTAKVRLLVTDVSMPNLSGPELAREAYRKCPNLRVLFISGGFESELKFRWSDPQLQKPFTPDQLVREVQRVIAGEPSDRWMSATEELNWEGPERRSRSVV